MSFALRLKSRPRNWQPQVRANLISAFGVDGAVTAANGVSTAFRNIIGAPFSLSGGASVTWTISHLGAMITQSGTNYFSRTRPWALSGSRTFAATLVCGSSGTQGVWSVAASEIVSTPHLLLQRNGTDLRLYAPGTGYVATFTGVATAGAVLRVAWGYTNVAASTAGTGYLAVNGQLKKGTYTGGTNAATNEYLFSGYSTQYLGGIGDFLSMPGCSPALIADLSMNPWQVFAP